MSRAERKRNELRQEIIDTAFDCFADLGYHNTGIADIAARLGIGHGTFYRYFENKRDIVSHVLTEVMNRVLTALVAENAPESVNTLEAYKEQTGRIAEGLIDVMADDPRLARILFLEATGIDPELTDRVLDFVDQAVAVTAGYLRHGVEAGYLRADLDVDNTARAINGMIIGATLNVIRHPDRASQRALADAIRRLMYDGVASR